MPYNSQLLYTILMFKNLSFHRIEEFLHTFYKHAPNLPYSLKKPIVEVIPYLVFIGGFIFIAPAILPYTGLMTKNPFPDYSEINVLLMRIMYIILGIILFFSFKPLSFKRMKGWYNLFYIGLFMVFFGLAFFDLTSLVFALFLIYILFQIKEFYT